MVERQTYSLGGLYPIRHISVSMVPKTYHEVGGLALCSVGVLLHCFRCAYANNLPNIVSTYILHQGDHIVACKSTIHD